MLGWSATASPQILRRAVAWHLSRPPRNADPDFAADDDALAAAGNVSDPPSGYALALARVSKTRRRVQPRPWWPAPGPAGSTDTTP